MELLILGSGTCAPTPGRTPPGYFLKAGAERIFIDPGPGAINRLVAAGEDPLNITCIFISHFHLDHCADIIPYLFSYKSCTKPNQRKDINIVASAGFRKFFDQLAVPYGEWIFSEEYEIAIEEARTDNWKGSGVSFITAPMLHSLNAIGFRFEADDGSTLVYSGDTAYCQEIINLSKGADTLLIECSMPDNMLVEGHMTPSGVGQVSVRSEVKKLVLTHINPQQNIELAMQTILDCGYKGEIVVAEDGMRLTI
jgi:ribonuclease BN (tRNA processing enzyme)